MTFVEELKRRNVIKVAVAYVVVAWLVMQFSDVILNNIEAPVWVFQVIMLVLVIGVMSVALAYFIWESRFSEPTAAATSERAGISQNTNLASNEPADIPDKNSSAVLPFAQRMLGNEDATVFTAEMRFTRALVLGMAGKREESLAELENLVKQGANISPWRLSLDPNWDFFRDDERFNELARPLNLDEARQ